MKTLTIPKTLFRSATFDKSAINEEERTVEMSISSDLPYQRYFGNEILDHSKESVNMSRMHEGAPLLFNHNRDAHIGRIISAKVDGKNLRVKAQFGNSALAQEKFQDVKDGILRETSVGYMVNRMVLECEDEKEGDTYRVTEWTPYEGSLVTIPADGSVGVGRSADDSETKTISVESQKDIDETSNLQHKQPTKLNTMPTEPTAEQKIEVNTARNEAVGAFKERCKKIRDYVDGLTNPNWKEVVGIVATKHMEGEAVWPDFHDEALRAMEKAGVVKLHQEATSKLIGMSQKNLADYSLVRAMNCIATKRPLDGPEREYSDQVAKDAGRDSQGFFIPNDVMRERYLAANVFTAAGALIESSAQGQSMIELLRNNMMVGKMGARFISGLKGNLAIPSQTGGATATWYSEDATISASNQTVGQVALTPHRLGAITAFTFQLLSQSTPDVESFVRNDLMMVLAIARDLAALSGSGVSGQPQGIYNTSNLSTPVTLAGANSMIYADAVKFETNVATNNALQGRLGYLASVATRGNSKLVAEISAANSIPVWKNDMVNGYPAYATTQLTTLPSVVYGNWDDLIIADWGAGGNEVIVDPYTLAAQGQVRIVMQQLCDIAIRHSKSFAVSST